MVPSPRLTIFSLPKPFSGEIGALQDNALASWAALEPRPEIVLVGDDQGVEAAAIRHGGRHVREIERSDLGTPLLDGAFRSVAADSETSTLCYVNADILLFQDFLDAIDRIPFDAFLMVGRRWDLDVAGAMDLADPFVRDELKVKARRNGTLHDPSGIDYFVYPKKLSWDMPPFVVGRPAWDNWLVYEARRRRIPVIDATRDTTVVHQNHGYGHVPQARTGYEGPEGDLNAALAGDRRCHIFDATHVLEDGQLRRPREREYLVEKFYTAHVVYPWTRPLMAVLRWLVRALRQVQAGFARRSGGR